MCNICCLLFNYLTHISCLSNIQKVSRLTNCYLVLREQPERKQIRIAAHPPRPTPNKLKEDLKLNAFVLVLDCAITNMSVSLFIHSLLRSKTQGAPRVCITAATADEDLVVDLASAMSQKIAPSTQ